MKTTMYPFNDQDDSDLKTPGHDQIVLSLTKEKIAQILDKTYPYQSLHDVNFSDDTSFGRFTFSTCGWGAKSNSKIENYCEMKIRHEIPAGGNRAIDIGVIVILKNSSLKEKYFFEIKTVIPSYGELMRQMNRYRERFPGEWFVVSPDDRFKDAIESQGIHFVKWPL